MRSHLSARSRLTLLYASLFTAGGAGLVMITYLLVASSLDSSAALRIPPRVQSVLGQCVVAAQTHGGAGILRKCAAVYSGAVRAGADAQRATALSHLLMYSLLSLVGATVLAAAAGWLAAGRMLRRLDLAMAGQRQFIANASHELRTPLTLMRTTMDVVLARPQPTRGELVSMAADLRQAVDHSERLVEALLMLARGDQSRAFTDPLDLAAVTEDALEGRTFAGLTAVTAFAEAPVTGEQVLLERLVSNLIDNAERYNIPGGTIEISTAATSTASVLRVVNTGAVIPAELVGRLFQPFTRLDDRTRHDGFGLGLALVSSIAAVHGGTIDASAVPAGGLDVTVRLPRRGTPA